MHLLLKACLTCLTLVCLIVFNSAVEAGTVFFDDFEDDTAGNSPALGGSNVGDSYGAVTNTVSVGANPEANGNTSAQVLVGAGASTFGNHIPALFVGGAKPIDGLTVSYDFYSSAATGHTNDGVRVSLVGNSDGVRDIFIRNDRDTEMLIDGADPGEANFGAEVWQNLTGVFTATNAAAGEYDLAWIITNLETLATVGGTQPVTVNTSNFTDGKARGISLEVFEGNAGANDFTGYVDNVHVEAVPEPSAMLLLILSAVVGLGLRRLR